MNLSLCNRSARIRLTPGFVIWATLPKMPTLRIGKTLTAWIATVSRPAFLRRERSNHKEQQEEITCLSKKRW
jgi:hypothetical protein